MSSRVLPGSIRAAGGVVWRERDQVLQIALVHRGLYDDWTLPKGKLHRGESELDAAVREIDEETGAKVAVTRRLTRVNYLFQGQPKTVVYWAMRALGGEFRPSDEVDQLVWLTMPEAAALLTNSSDRDVLRSFTAMPMADAVVILVRHAKAGRRSDWKGADHLRPLEKAGRGQARALSRFLNRFGPERILAADRTRCVQTVEPLAADTGLGVEIAPVFSDESFSDNPENSLRELLAVAKPGGCTVICSQGSAIPGLLDLLDVDLATTSTRKGGAWVITFVDGETIAADDYPDAAR